MLFQLEAALITIISLIIATIVLTLVIYIVVILIESKHKASDKKFMILLLAFISVLILPVILGAIGMVLGAIGDLFAGIRDIIDGGGHNYVIGLVPIIGFLILLVLTKYLVDIPWDHAVWIALLTLFILYIFYSITPELVQVLGFGLVI